MGSLHEALQCLGPTTWDEVPKEQPELRDYLRDIARKARLIVDSVPEQEPKQQSQQQQESAAAEECDTTQHSHDTSHTPGKPYKISTSSARASTNTGTADPELQRQWGKPIRAGDSRDNPYGIPMYKMQAADGKAAWFARRSVHEGMPYSRWKEKLSDEMEWTLRMNKARLEKGQAPDRVIRGLGAAKKVEEVSVFGDDDGDGSGGDGKEVLGGVKVFDICAHFPKPTTPRDFVQLCASWGEDMGEDSDDKEGKQKGQRQCRNWVFVSKPCVHPDLASYDGYLRGQYESVEFIREVLPARDDKIQGSGKSAKSVTWSDTNLAQHGEQESQKDKKSRSRISTESPTPEKRDEKPDGSVDDDETNPYPVEWIMVTRSDPGGSIPRWIIEKGTPKSIWGDTVKFLDWARQDQDQDQETPPRESAEDSSKPATPVQETAASEDGHADSDLYDDSVNASEKETEKDTHPEGEQRTGLIASFAYLVNAGLERYAPKAVLDYVPYQHAYGSTQRISTYNTDDDDDDDDDDTASFVSTESNPNNINNDKKNDANASSASVVSDALSRHNVPPIDTMDKERKEKLSSHEKQLAKLAQRKRDVQDKLDAVRAEIEELRIDAGADATTRDEKGEKPDETKDKKDETKEIKDETKEVKETRDEKNRRKEEEKAKKEEGKARRGKEKEEEKARKDKEKEEEKSRKEKEKEEEKARKEKEKEEKKKEREKEKEEKRREKELEKEKKKNDKIKSKQSTPDPEAESDGESSSNEKPKEATASEKEAARSSTNVSLRSKTPSKSQDDLSRQEDDSDGRSTTTSKRRQTTSIPANPNIPQIHKAASHLFAQESKLLKQLGKIEREQIKTASKVDARQQKQHEREEKIRSRLERDQLRSEIDGAKEEVERLRGERQQWMDLVAQVQEENARLKKQQNEVGLGQGQG